MTSTEKKFFVAVAIVAVIACGFMMVVQPKKIHRVPRAVQKIHDQHEKQMEVFADMIASNIVKELLEGTNVGK